MKSPIEQAIEFVARWQPAFPSQVAPASAQEIAELEAAAGAKMPEPCRHYYERLGHGLALEKLGDADFDITAIIKRYRFGYTPPPAYWMIGRANGDPQYDLYLHSPTGREARVVSFPPPPLKAFDEFARKHLLRVAGNVPQWLALAAIKQHVFPQLPLFAVPGASRPEPRRLAGCDAALAPAGLAPLWFSDDWLRVYEGEHGLAIASEFPTGPLTVLLRSASKDSLARLSKAAEQACTA